MLFRTSEVRRVDDEGLAKKQGLKGTHGNREFADLTLLICNIRSRCFDNLVKHILSLLSGATRNATSEKVACLVD